MCARWGFFDDDQDGEAGDEHQEPTPEASQTLWGSDTYSVVSIGVTDMAHVVSARLSPDWKASVDPRSLHASVREASTAATMRALEKQIEHTDMDGSSHPASELQRHRGGQANPDQSPVTKEDVLRLLEEASRDLERYTREASAVADRSINAQSAGGHVSMSARRQQVHEVTIDSRWAASARYTEIESELLDVLRRLDDQASLAPLANEPRSKAISELMNLASDPQALARRIRPTE